MRNLSLFMLLFLLFLPVWSAEGKKTYVAKSKKSLPQKKKSKSKHRPVRYPVRVNTSVSADDLKLNQMLKDIYE